MPRFILQSGRHGEWDAATKDYKIYKPGDVIELSEERAASATFIDRVKPVPDRPSIEPEVPVQVVEPVTSDPPLRFRRTAKPGR